MLENIGANDRIKRPRRNLQIELLNITHPHLVQPLPRRGRSLAIELDARNCRLLAPLDCLAKPPGPAPNVEHPPSRPRHKLHHLRPSIAEVKRIRARSAVARMRLPVRRQPRIV